MENEELKEGFDKSNYNITFQKAGFFKDEVETIIKVLYYYDNETCEGLLSNSWNQAPEEIKGNLNKKVFNNFCLNFIKDEQKVVNFIKADKKHYNHDIAYFFSTMANLLKLYGINIDIEAINKNVGIELEKIKDENELEERKEFLILSNKKDYLEIKKDFKEREKEVKLLFKDKFINKSPREIRTKFEMTIEEYAVAIKTINDVNKNYFLKGIIISRDKDGWLYMTIDGKLFMINETKTKEVKTEETIGKNLETIGCLVLLRINGKLMFEIKEKNSLEKYYKAVANKRARQIRKEIYTLETLDHLIFEVNEQLQKSKKMMNNLENKSVEERNLHEVEMLKKIRIAIGLIEKYLNTDINSFIKPIRLKIIELQKERDDTLIVLGKEKQLLISYRDTLEGKNIFEEKFEKSDEQIKELWDNMEGLEKVMQLNEEFLKKD
ncbi:MAG: hypothetical protein ACRC4M_05770 [Mycoplasma sp.]